MRNIFKVILLCLFFSGNGTALLGIQVSDIQGNADYFYQNKSQKLIIGQSVEKNGSIIVGEFAGVEISDHHALLRIDAGSELLMSDNHVFELLEGGVLVTSLDKQEIQLSIAAIRLKIINSMVFTRLDRNGVVEISVIYAENPSPVQVSHIRSPEVSRLYAGQMMSVPRNALNLPPPSFFNVRKFSESHILMRPTAFRSSFPNQVTSALQKTISDQDALIKQGYLKPDKGMALSQIRQLPPVASASTATVQKPANPFIGKYSDCEIVIRSPLLGVQTSKFWIQIDPSGKIAGEGGSAKRSFTLNGKLFADGSIELNTSLGDEIRGNINQMPLSLSVGPGVTGKVYLRK